RPSFALRPGRHTRGSCRRPRARGDNRSAASRSRSAAPPEARFRRCAPESRGRLRKWSAFEIPVVTRSLVLDPVLELVTIFAKDPDGCVARGIAHPADRRTVVHARDADHLVEVLV